MALVVKDRVLETSTTTGTGTFTLGGASTGYQTFSASIGNGNTTYYSITNGSEWEVGIGTVSAGQLSRDTVLESSNSGSLVNFSAGTKNVFCTYPAEKSVDIDTAQTLTNKTISGANNTLSNIGNSSLTNSSITINGTAISLGGSVTVGGGISWNSVQTTSFTAVSNNGYPVNTTSGAVTVTLPASPAAGDSIAIVDYAGTAATNNIIIARNGNKINAASADAKMSTTREAVTLTYIDSTQGWVGTSEFGYFTLNAYTGTYLVVAGGGGGGGGIGGGGGAGGYRTSTINIQKGTTYTVTVGAGGTGSPPSAGVGTQGGNSVFGSITSIGGGYGGSYGSGSGGSGGAQRSAPGSPGTAGQGYPGGVGGGNSGGGGGGASAIGGNGGTNNGGVGGSGSTFAPNGLTYAGGGGGGGYANPGGTGGAGGAGGGGSGSQFSASPGTANTGGGGGGGGYSIPTNYPGGAGGSGIVFLIVPTAEYSGTTTGSPTVTTSGSDTIIKWTSSGSYTG